jgi:hypothetical protein
MPTTATSSS